MPQTERRLLRLSVLRRGHRQDRAIGQGAHIGWQLGRTHAKLEPRLVLDVEEEPARIPGLPAAWVGRRIAVVGDFQAGIWLGRGVSTVFFGTMPRDFWRAKLSSRTLSQPASNLPLNLSIQALGACCGACAVPGAR